MPKPFATAIIDGAPFGRTAPNPYVTHPILTACLRVSASTLEIEHNATRQSDASTFMVLNLDAAERLGRGILEAVALGRAAANMREAA